MMYRVIGRRLLAIALGTGLLLGTGACTNQFRMCRTADHGAAGQFFCQ
jgi:hypothetical protein